jgi:serine/threonine-protein kinase
MTALSQHIPSLRYAPTVAAPAQPRASNETERIAGRYEVQRSIGSGSWGHVVEARDVVLGRRVALKILRERSPETRRRFLREARIVAAVSHPNVLTLHDVGETSSGDPFLVTELVDGEDLAEKLRFRRMSVGETVEIARGVLRALEALNERGIVHRDVKPENVLIDSSGTVKLVDFGVSHCASLSKGRNTQQGVVLGTPLYMSPEQVSAADIDIRSDIYSLGAMMYEMLSRKTPHDAPTPVVIFASILNDPIAPLRTHCPEIPPELEAIIHRALAFSPEDRFQTPREMEEALAAFAASRRTPSVETTPVPALHAGSTCIVRPLSMREEPPARKPRRALKASLAALAILGGIFAGTFDFEHNRFRLDEHDSARILAYFGIDGAGAIDTAGSAHLAP